MELLVWRLCRYEILIVLNKVVPAYTTVNRIWQHSFFPLVTEYSPTLLIWCVNNRGPIWIWIFLITCEFKYLYMFIEHVCFFSEFSVLCPSLMLNHFIIFLLICRRNQFMYINDFGKKILTFKVINWHFTIIYVSYHHWFLNFYLWK